MSKPEQLALRRQQLQAHLELRSEIWFAYLHGSALERLPYQDLDIAVYLEPAHPDANDPYDYEMRLSVEKKQALRFPVDVHAVNQAPLGFQHNAVQGEQLRARDADALSECPENLARLYMEFAPFGRTYLLEVLTG